MKLYFTWEDRIGPVVYITVLNKRFGLCFCHRKKERSFNFLGLENFLCARCLGILIGCVTGIIMRVLGFYLPVIVSVFFLLPLILDGLLQAIYEKESKNLVRLVTGLLGGIGIISLLNFATI